MKKKLKTLEEHNDMVWKNQQSFADLSRPQKNGISCPKCGEEMWDSNPMITLTSNPAAAPNPIETLPGAQNLGEIADIEYIQKKLLAALRIPKAFLGSQKNVHCNCGYVGYRYE